HQPLHSFPTRRSSDLEDTLNPNLLHVYCYNPGILKPLDINDQDEDERTAVMHKAIPKNMDILVFQYFFEPRNVSEIFNNLKPYRSEGHTSELQSRENL